VCTLVRGCLGGSCPSVPRQPRRFPRGARVLADPHRGARAGVSYGDNWFRREGATLSIAAVPRLPRQRAKRAGSLNPAARVKVVLEKILRDCPGVAGIFILIRPKKGVSPQVPAPHTTRPSPHATADRPSPGQRPARIGR